VPGPAGRFEHRQTVAAAAVTPASIIAIKLAPAQDTDENDPELADVAALVAVPGTGSFDVVMTFPTPHSGPFNLHYQVT
jgi:hypothetical protein